MYIKVKATPGAKKESIKSVGSDALVITVREPAERNLANNRIRELVADHFQLAVHKVRLISGHRSPSKIFSVTTD